MDSDAIGWSIYFLGTGSINSRYQCLPFRQSAATRRVLRF